MAADTRGNGSETARVEAFSDGVFAIAITLLVLDLKVPRDLAPTASLTGALLRQWPSYFAYLTSFLTIGIMWLNHHRLYTLIRRSDHVLLLLNGLLLLGVSVVPFPTSLVAAYLGAPPGDHRRRRLQRHLRRDRDLLQRALALLRLAHAAARAGDRCGRVRALGRQYAGGPFFYLVAFVLAWVSPAASLAVNFALALFFALAPRLMLRRSPSAATRPGRS